MASQVGYRDGRGNVVPVEIDEGEIAQQAGVSGFNAKFEDGHTQFVDVASLTELPDEDNEPGEDEDENEDE